MGEKRGAKIFALCKPVADTVWIAAASNLQVEDSQTA